MSRDRKIPYEWESKRRTKWPCGFGFIIGTIFSSIGWAVVIYSIVSRHN